jgi:hypothetical protein
VVSREATQGRRFRRIGSGWMVGKQETMLSNDDPHSASNCTKTGLKVSSE